MEKLFFFPYSLSPMILLCFNSILQYVAFAQDPSIKEMQSNATKDHLKITKLTVAKTGKRAGSLTLISAREAKAIGPPAAMTFPCQLPPILVFMLFIKRADIAGIIRLTLTTAL